MTTKSLFSSLQKEIIILTIMKNHKNNELNKNEFKIFIAATLLLCTHK